MSYRILGWTPPLLVLLVLVTNNRAVMGKRVNGVWLTVFGWFTALLLFGTAVALVLTSLRTTRVYFGLRPATSTQSR